MPHTKLQAAHLYAHSSRNIGCQGGGRFHGTQHHRQPTQDVGDKDGPHLRSTCPHGTPHYRAHQRWLQKTHYVPTQVWHMNRRAKTKSHGGKEAHCLRKHNWYRYLHLQGKRTICFIRAKCCYLCRHSCYSEIAFCNSELLETLKALTTQVASLTTHINAIKEGPQRYPDTYEANAVSQQPRTPYRELLRTRYQQQPQNSSFRQPAPAYFPPPPPLNTQVAQDKSGGPTLRKISGTYWLT